MIKIILGLLSFLFINEVAALDFPPVSVSSKASIALQKPTSSSHSQCHHNIKINLQEVDLRTKAYQRFKAWVDRSMQGKPKHGFSAVDVIYLYCFTHDKRYALKAIEMVDMVVREAELKINSGKPPKIAGDSYLHVGKTLFELSLVYDWAGDLLSKDQQFRWSTFAEQAVWNIWHHKQARWSDFNRKWSGWSVNNPGNNYHYGFLWATMSWGLASQNETWLSLLRDTKFPILVEYFKRYPGGGSLEGTGYGISHMRLFLIDKIWRESTGQGIGIDQHIADSINYWIHATMPTLDYHAPIGDQSRVSIPKLYDYQRELMLLAQHNNEQASWWLDHISVNQMQHGGNFKYDLLPVLATPKQPEALSYLAVGLGHLFARSDWSQQAEWLGFIAGPYTESHGHQDQGSLTLYKQTWLAVTENIWTSSGIVSGVEFQNTLRFSKAGETLPQSKQNKIKMQVEDQGTILTASANLSPAYQPNPKSGNKSRYRSVLEAKINWNRKIVFERDKQTVLVEDKFSHAKGVQAVWQLNVPVQPHITKDGIVAGKLRIKPVFPVQATVKLIDWTTQKGTKHRTTYSKGWKVELHGGIDRYEVLLEVLPDS